METIEQREKRRNDNLHSLSEIESAGNIIVKISEQEGILLTKIGNTYTFHIMITRSGINYWKPVNASVR
jgi:hypothetical protein